MYSLQSTLNIAVAYRFPKFLQDNNAVFLEMLSPSYLHAHRITDHQEPILRFIRIDLYCGATSFWSNTTTSGR